MIFAKGENSPVRIIALLIFGILEFFMRHEINQHLTDQILDLFQNPGI